MASQQSVIHECGVSKFFMRTAALTYVSTIHSIVEISSVSIILLNNRMDLDFCGLENVFPHSVNLILKHPER